ncbi:MAG: hypothetical protein ACK42L_10260 [Thermoanaerobaculum sp.]
MQRVGMRWLGVALSVLLAHWAEAANFSGTITKIATRTFTVRRGPTEKTFVLGENAEVTKSGKRVRLSDLKVGQAVVVIYETVDDKNVAQRVVAEELEKERHENQP